MSVATLPPPARRTVLSPDTLASPAAPPISPRRVSVEEYLRAERKATRKHEYIKGVVREMAGGTHEHSVIGTYLAGAFINAVEALNCRVLNSDQSIHIEPGVFYYPDMSVVEGEPQIDFDEALRNPVIVIEVLSSSTESFDRGEKFINYRRIPSLRHYLMVSQERPFVEHYARDEDGGWVLTDVQGLDATLTLSNPDIAIPLAKIYRYVTFPALEAADAKTDTEEEPA